MVFSVGDYVLKADRVPAQQLPRRVDQVFRQPQPPADFKGVALSRHPDAQPVGRPQRFHVELHGGVLHALRRQGKSLQFAVVGRRERSHADVKQPGQDALCQRRAFGGVRARAQFVKQHQVPGRHLVHDLHDVRHVPAEGAQALFDALLVADIREHLLEHRQFRSQVRRHLQA